MNPWEYFSMRNRFSLRSFVLRIHLKWSILLFSSSFCVVSRFTSHFMHSMFFLRNFQNIGKQNFEFGLNTIWKKNSYTWVSLSGERDLLLLTANFSCNVLVIRRAWKPVNEFHRITRPRLVLVIRFLTDNASTSVYSLTGHFPQITSTQLYSLSGGPLGRITRP